MIDIALIGCAHIHVPGFASMIKKRSDVRVKYAFDDDTRRSQFWAGELGASVADVKTILVDASVGGVVVCTETKKHEGLVSQIVAAKKNLFVEKPLGFAASDAKSMAAAIDKAGLTFQTGYFRRGDAKLQFLRKQIQAGAFGKITRVRASNCHSGALGGWFDAKPSDTPHDWNWMAHPDVSGCGAFGDLGTHVLDILIWMLGDVAAVTGSINAGTGRYGTCDETGEAMLKFQNGAIGTVAASWDDLGDPVTFQINGTEGQATIIGEALHFKSTHAGFDGSHPVRASEMPTAMPHAFDLFLDALNGKDVPLVSPTEAAYRNTVMEAIYKAAKSQTWEAI